MEGAGHVIERLGQGDAIAGALSGLIGIAERPGGHRSIPMTANTGIVTAIYECMASVLLGIVERQTLANVFQTASKVTVMRPSGPGRVVSLKNQTRIADPVGDFDQLAEVSAWV